MDRLLGPRRRTAPQPEPLEAPSRAEAQRHLAARLERLRAYAATLEDAATSRPPDPHLAWLARQLVHVRRDLRAAGRARLSAPGTEPGPPASAGGAGAPGAPGPPIREEA
jgi:hypothetical protein